MRIVAWNIRAGGGQRVAAIAEQLQAWQPDLVVLCEFRHTPPSRWLAEALAAGGLHHQLTTAAPHHPAANALLIAARETLQPLPLPLTPPYPLRWLPARLGGPQPLTVAALHVPNYLSKQKQPFFDGLLTRLQQWPAGPGILIGDTNSGLPEIDEENPVFTELERSWFAALATLGWHDIYRRLHGNRRSYTWYSPNAGNGFRLDQAFISKPLVPHVRAMEYVSGVDVANPTRRNALSDHAAILLDLV